MSETKKHIVTIEQISEINKKEGSGLITYSPYIEYIIKEDDELIWSCKTTSEKWCNTSTPLRIFEEWLTGEERQKRCKVCHNRGNRVKTLRTSIFQRIKFKLKFFKFRLKNFKKK